MLRLGGGGWIRTTEAKRNRFTVCPLWPLGNSSVFDFGAGGRTRTPDLLITNQLLYQLSYTSASYPQQRNLFYQRKGGLSRKKLYILKRDFSHLCVYPLQDSQLEPPVDWCGVCGGEIYRFDPVVWDRGPPVCPACAARKERERKSKREE